MKSSSRPIASSLKNDSLAAGTTDTRQDVTFEDIRFAQCLLTIHLDIAFRFPDLARPAVTRPTRAFQLDVMLVGKVENEIVG